MSHTTDVLEEHIKELQRTIATGYCGECDIHKEKIEDILSKLKNGIPVWLILEEYGGSE